MNTKEKTLYSLWLVLYPIVAGLGFIQGATGIGKVLLMLLSVGYFVPGLLLVLHGLKEGGKPALRRLRLLSGIVLLATLVATVANVLSAYAVNSEALGIVMHILLALVSVPMFCAQYRIIGLFLWACLFVATFQKPKA